VDAYLVITNSEAGTSDKDRLDAAIDLLSEGASVEVASTSSPGELDGVLHRAGSRRIVVAGGDGSLHAVVKALYRRHELSDAVLGLIPLGTGNDFARGTDIPLDPEEAARLVLEGEPRSVDLIVDEVGQIVVNNVHLGVSAHASLRGARWKERLGKVGLGKVNLGKMGYPIGAFQSVLQPPYTRVRIEVDGELVADLDRPVLMLSVGNGASVGGGTELTPEADPEDGKVDVMIARAQGGMAPLTYAWHLMRSRHHERDDVMYLRGKEVSVSGEEFYCSADGEIYGPERQRTWHVEPAAYSMILPD
jgi:YegS/Rv2252/BmrU family lipid kinase